MTDEQKEPEPGALDLEALRWFAGLVRPYVARLGVAGFALVLSGGVSLAFPLVAGKVVDAAVQVKDTTRLDHVVLGLIGLFAVSSVLGYTENYVLRWTSADLLQDLKRRVHGHLLSLGPSFFEAQRTGDLLSRLNSDVEQIGGVLTGRVVSGLQQALVLVGAVSVLLTMHWQLTLVMLVAVPPVVIVAVLFGRKLRNLSKQERDAAAEASASAEQALSGIRTVQAFAREPHERERYATRLATATELALRAGRAWAIFEGVVSFFAFTAVTFVLWYGGRLVVTGVLTAGQLTSFLAFTVSVAGAIGSLTGLYGALRAASGATERVRQILDTRPDIDDPAQPLPLQHPRGRVQFESVAFAYPANKERRALDRITIDVPEGKCLALVGPSGSGKSTLVSLLLRFYDPVEGRVLVDGEDVRRYRVKDLRSMIGLVPQDIVLFAGTIAENVRYGRPDATDDEVRAACEAAQAHAFVDALPQKYESLVGERGVKLSGGERQRIAIARVLLKDPRIVILDEATSSLDSESEHLVEKAFERLLEKRTTIVIAHRLKTVRRADRVVLLEHGLVREEGTHEELIARAGLYRRLVELQMLDVAPAAGAPPATASDATGGA